MWLQAEEVRRVADSELGFQQVALSRPTQAKTYLFVNAEHTVVGCLVAEHIRQVETQTWKRPREPDGEPANADVSPVPLFRRTESWTNQSGRKTRPRKTSWRGTEPGAAPPVQSRLSAGSAGSGCSAWPGGGASPAACWTPSGNARAR